MARKKKKTAAYKKNCVVVALHTTRGIVYVEFTYDGKLQEIFPIDEEKWDPETWRKGKHRLVRQARKLCLVAAENI